MANRFVKKLLLFVLSLSGSAHARGRYSEMTLPLQPKRPIYYATDHKNNTLILYFKDPAAEQLELLNTYDERLIRRMIIKDRGHNNFEIRLMLRDHNIAFRITELQEPPRLNLSFFDKNYALDRDPITQLPLSGIGNPMYLAQRTDDEEPAFFKHDDDTIDPDSDKNLRVLQIPLAQVDKQGKDLPHGRGDEWKKYPPYIYSIAMSLYKESSKNQIHDTNNDNLALADQAFKLFSYGDEKQALNLYQKVLYQDPTVFDRDPFHMWALGECNFGQGNLSLADGYYNSIQEKFPSSPLARFAAHRRIDVKALERIRSGKYNELSALAKENAASPLPIAELEAQKLLRRAYWNRQDPSDQHSLPICSKDIIQDLSARSPTVENAKTSFLANAVILKNMLQPDAMWNTQTSQFANNFFTNYANVPEDDYLQDLRKDLRTKVGSSLQNNSTNGRYAEAVAVYENLPSIVKDIIDAPENAWAVAEAYRNTQRSENSLSFYKTVFEKDTNATNRFKAGFWLSSLNHQIAQRLKESNKAGAAEPHISDSRSYDAKILESWKQLNQNDKASIKKSNHLSFEKSVADNSQLRMPAIALLEIYKDEAPATAPASEKATPTPPESTSPEDAQKLGDRVVMIHKLAEYFAQLNLPSERLETLNLLRNFDPKKFPNHILAQSAWASDLISLAEDYRKANEFLKAGQLYVYAADHAVNWEKRAEAYYKGGLLIYRGGNRDDAVKALTSASQDGNNLFYSNLAKERLTQFKK